MAQRFFSRGNFGYGKWKITDVGQILELVGAVNDEKLVRLGHLRRVEDGAPTFTCGKCGAEFTMPGLLSNHGNLRHASLSPGARDAAEDRARKMANDVAPLNMDKTLASGGGRPAEVRTSRSAPHQP